MKNEFRYGDNNTIHRSNQVDVEVDSNGNVVSVWFRCAALPFKQANVDETRAREMRWMYRDADHGYMRPIKAIIFGEGQKPEEFKITRSSFFKRFKELITEEWIEITKGNR